jgi:hypothetical protein
MDMTKRLVLYKEGKRIEVPINKASNGKLYSLISINNNELFNRTDNWCEISNINAFNHHSYVIINISKKGERINIPGTDIYIEGEDLYYGEGGFDPRFPDKSRMINHPGTQLDKAWEENEENMNNWVAVAIGWGMLKEEAEAHEALCLNWNSERRTKRGEIRKEGNLFNVMSEKRNYETKTKKLIKEKIWKLH